MALRRIAFAAVDRSVAVGVFEIIRQAVSIGIGWVSIGVGSYVMEADIDHRIGLFDAVREHGVVIKAEHIGVRASAPDENAVRWLIKSSKRSGLPGKVVGEHVVTTT